MKKLLLLFTLIPCLAFGQNTYVPDDIFEQRLIWLGYDTGIPDDSVPTANINTVTSLDLHGYGITDLTGIEDFVALTYLDCGDNQLTSTSLDVSNSTALTYLDRR
jgi:Leucine-rich repeat (LRR) protein